MNGGGMCVHQAVDAFRLFTGLVPDVARMKRMFEKACAARDDGFIDGRTEMKTAIATVCLSGALDEKLEAIAARGLRAASRSSRTTCCPSTARPPTSGA